MRWDHHAQAAPYLGGSKRPAGLDQEPLGHRARKPSKARPHLGCGGSQAPVSLMIGCYRWNFILSKFLH